MKTNSVLMAALTASMSSASLMSRDVVGDLTTLTSTVKTHTGNINQTLATLPTTTAASGNSTANATVAAEFNLIAQALNSSSETSTAADTCDATCQLGAYNGLGALSAEIAYTMEGCIEKNTVDLTSNSSVLLTVVEALSDVTTGIEESVPGAAGIVVQNLQAAMGSDIGGALSTFIEPA